MNQPVAVHANGASAETAVARRPRTPKPPGDDHIRAMYAEYEDGANLRDIAKKHHVSNTTLAKHFKRLGLEMRPKGFQRGKQRGDHHPDTRQPYTAPTVTAVPLNGDGPHAEAAREMVAERVGAQTSAETAVALATPEPAQTAVSFDRIAFLVESMRAMGIQVEAHGEININISF